MFKIRFEQLILTTPRKVKHNSTVGKISYRFVLGDRVCVPTKQQDLNLNIGIEKPIWSVFEFIMTHKMVGNTSSSCEKDYGDCERNDKLSVRFSSW